MNTRTRNSEVCLLYSEADKAIANLLADAFNYYSIDIWQAKNISIGSEIINETITALTNAKRSDNSPAILYFSSGL